MPDKGYHAPNVFNLEKGIIFSFRSRYVFERSYLEPPYPTLDMPFPRPPFTDPDAIVCELMLEMIWFDDSKFEGNLPFGLKFGDANTEFIKQGKPYKKISYTNIYGSCFIRDKYELQLQFDKDHKLLRMFVSLIGNDIRRFFRREETIKEQNKNIKSEFVNNVLLWKDAKPTERWCERMKGGDDCFSGENIEATDKILDDFINQLAAATNEKKAGKVLSTIKKVVTALNKLNAKYNHIETMEREELCAFIDSAIKQQDI